ncbi:HAD family phosphatase [Sulfitobacter noctilucae]|uniref:hypothetical protein n=1 Tax=Sulfitobacter noctilucae TaxID=1342302 RepID=UPI000468DB10|nr:hypothetical protein [Sulfitobacter noctilucae]KIN65790.1 HAD family phosphatase [Sulfitobacter noctilucae]
MGLAEAIGAGSVFQEDIRLVIWDLDETFWDGTMTEGGMRYRMDHHQLVITLAERGIMSAICSKNDAGLIEAELRERGLWDYFIFPSIDWSPKGPRIAAMLDQIGLRAQSVLFLDDNPMNLAQAVHANPGLNIGPPEMICTLADAPHLQGKPDPELRRLAQYKVKERKASAAQVVEGDAIALLRQSNVRVYIEYDVEAHLDRAIELINRTNQLNFTKKRLPDDLATARAELSALLALNTTDAGLIRVCDDYGDYGFAGFYLTERLHNVRRMKHFCFSCRTLNMYVEHWTYDFLNRPPMQVVGEVLSDVMNDPVKVDWITPAAISDISGKAPSALRFDNIFARGGCDLASLMHYFALHSDHIHEEFNQPLNGQMFRRDHTSFLMPALGDPLTEEEMWAAASLGYGRADFQSDLTNLTSGRNLCFLSCWADADIPVYRHRATGLRLPYWLVGAQNQNLIARAELREAVAETDIQRQRLNVLCRDFEHEGLLGDAEMLERYTTILDAIPDDVQIILVLAPLRGPLHFQNPERPDHPHHKRLNAVLRQVASGRTNVMLLDPADFIEGAEDMIDLNHFKRPVFHRMYRAVLDHLGAAALGTDRKVIDG